MLKAVATLLLIYIQESSLSPVIDLLRKEGMFSAAPPSLLIHVFSNGKLIFSRSESKTRGNNFLGGGLQLVELSRMLESTSPIPGSSPPTAIIYDSVPGKIELVPTLAAFTAPIKSTLGKLIISIPLTVLYYVLLAITFVMRKRPWFDELRERLNAARVLPWTNEDTPKLYIYSDTDKLVQENAVAEHIAQAKELGRNVRAELFKGSAHVSHARHDKERYWAAVQSVWAEAVTIRK